MRVSTRASRNKGWSLRVGQARACPHRSLAQRQRLGTISARVFVDDVWPHASTPRTLRHRDGGTATTVDTPDMANNCTNSCFNINHRQGSKTNPGRLFPRKEASKDGIRDGMYNQAMMFIAARDLLGRPDKRVVHYCMLWYSIRAGTRVNDLG